MQIQTGMALVVTLFTLLALACGGKSSSSDSTQQGSDTIVVAGDAQTGDLQSADQSTTSPEVTVGPGSAPVISGCQIFPDDNPWNSDVSKEPVDPASSQIIAKIGANTDLHPDFGTTYQGAPNGIPFVVVDGNQSLVPVSFTYASESDQGPYPVPTDAPIEGGPNGTGDRHILMLRTSDCKLFELYAAYPHNGGASWTAGSGAIFDLSSNALRSDGWTSADAAGLPIFPGLVKYDEVESGEIKHALRFTVDVTRKAYLHPATHWASDNTASDRPPMGMRVRLKASFDISGYTPRLQVILKAMKKYGMFLADNGSDWYVSGAPDPRWDDDELRQLGQLQGGDFEVVKMGQLHLP